MKKIWTLLVAAITVLAVLTSGCGSSDKAAKPLINGLFARTDIIYVTFL